MVEFFNRIALLVASEILYEVDTKRRVCVISKVIQVRSFLKCSLVLLQHEHYSLRSRELCYITGNLKYIFAFMLKANFPDSDQLTGCTKNPMSRARILNEKQHCWALAMMTFHKISPPFGW